MSITLARIEAAAEGYKCKHSMHNILGELVTTPSIVLGHVWLFHLA